MSEKKQKHLLIAAAGTGGHVMPGLAVAHALEARGWRISWMGTTTGMEGELVSKHDITDFIGLPFRGLRGKGLMGMIKGVIGLIQSKRIVNRWLKTHQPDAIFTTGGYIAVPVCQGRGQNYPIVLMNCDADLLLSSKVILHDASAVACGFAGQARSAAKEKGHLTGNPVRAAIEAVPAPEVRFAQRDGRLRLLVFGGSLGAQVLNETIPKTLALFKPEDRPIVLHQTGTRNLEKVRQTYADLGIEAEVVGFIDDMAKAYEESDLVICRSGAMTVSELCAAGAASVLVPFVVKTTKHQLGNARYMAKQGASFLIEQSQLTPEHLYGVIATTRRERLLEMAQKARALARSNAAQAVADCIERVAK